MLTYILEVSICWGAFYLLYWLLLSRDTFFHFNRWYLVSTLLASLVIPAVEWELPHRVAESEIATVYFQPITVGLETFEVTVTATPITSGVELLDVLTWMYWAGMAFCMIRFLIGMRQIYSLYRKSEKRQLVGYQIILSEKVHPPFSFFNRLFISKSVELDPEDREAILRHELAHIRGGHSYDILILEILNAVFWCSPFIYLYRWSLRNVHEYIADAAVLRTTKKKQYGHLLIRQSQSGPAIAIANHFHSQLKKRILMMMRNPSKRRAILKYLLVIPLTLLVLLVFSNAEAKASLQEQAQELQQNLQEEFAKKEIVNNPSDPEKILSVSHDTLTGNEPYTLEIYTTSGDTVVIYDVLFKGEGNGKKTFDDYVNMSEIDQIYFDTKKHYAKVWQKGTIKRKPLGESDLDEEPRFEGCEEIADQESRDRCTRIKLLSYIHSKIKYPEKARSKGIQGSVIVAFTIDENGNVKDPEISRSIGGGCDEEAIRVVKQMPRWVPGKKEGKNVSSTFVLPVQFVLMNADPEEIVVPREQPLSKDTIVTYDPTTFKTTYHVVDFNNTGVFVVGRETDQLKPFHNENVLHVVDGVAYSFEMGKEFIKTMKIAENIKLNKIEILQPNKALRKYGERGRRGAIEYHGLSYNLPGQNNNTFKVVDQMPRFPFCEDSPGDAKVKQNCADLRMMEFVCKNIQYPAEARERGIEGMVVVQFLVGKDGIIREPKIMKGIGGGCDEEVLRIVNLMPRLVPGKQNGQAVDMHFNLPVRFRLGKGENSTVTAPSITMATPTAPDRTLELQGFSASPNPSNGIVNLSFQGERKPTFIKVFDLQGKEVQSLYLANFNGTYNEQLDLSRAPKGTLIISIIQGDKIYSERILVQ